MSSASRTVLSRPGVRAAGLLYLAIIVCGIGGEALLRGPLVVADDAGRTAANLAAAALTFRLGILADVVMALSDVALAVLLYVLFRPVDRTLSMMAMAFRLVQAAILGLNLVHLHDALALLGTAALSVEQRDALVLLHLDAHATGYDLGLFFFGINCLLVGALARRADFVPTWLGRMISAAGVVYLLGSATRVVAPELVGALEPAYVVPVVAEVAFCVWLLRGGPARARRDGRAVAGVGTPCAARYGSGCSAPTA